MAHNPKLEIYKINLFNKETGNSTTFREFFARRLGHFGRKMEDIPEDNEVYKKFFEDFIKKVTSKYHSSSKKKKAFKIEKGEGDKGNVSYKSDAQYIKGILSGGSHGRKGHVGALTDPENETPIEVHNIVGFNFFFLLYAPFNHYEGVILIQSYTGSTISDVFRDFLKKYFSHSEIIKSEISLYVPTFLKDKYIEGAVFKGIEFTSDWILDGDRDGHKQKKYEVQVKIEIIDKSEHKTAPQGFTNAIRDFTKGLLTLNGKPKELDKFRKKPKMVNDGKPALIDVMDLHANIKPVLLLEKVGIAVREGLVPDFSQIDTYCCNLLPDILEENLPKHAVKRL
jgi:hypothetical protein